MTLHRIQLAIDLFGTAVGMVALSISVWTLFYDRELYDAPYVAALYIVGILIIFLSVEVGVSNSWIAVFARTTIFVAVGWWEIVTIRQFLSDDNKLGDRP